MTTDPQQTEKNKLIILQAVFGVVFLLVGMFLITPSVSSSKSIELLFYAVALLYFKDGLIQLISAFIAIVKKDG